MYNYISMYNEVIFDVETKKLFGEVEKVDPSLLGVSIVSAYIRTLDDNNQEIQGKMQSFWEEDFDKFWPVLQKADRIIGFNSIKFDVPCLQPYTTFNLAKLPHFDLMDEVKKIIGRRISLDAFAKDTLDKEKSDVGVNAVLYWQSGTKENLDKLRQYCEMDVEITRQLYDFGLKNKYLKYKDKWNTPRQVKVDFSYPVESKEKQIGLF